MQRLNYFRLLRETAIPPPWNSSARSLTATSYKACDDRVTTAEEIDLRDWKTDDFGS